MNANVKKSDGESCPGGGFIVLEGIEGVGKTTQMKAISDYLRGLGQTVVLTREPGGTPLAEEIRAILLDETHTGMADKTELLLVFAARAPHGGGSDSPTD